MLVSIHRSPSYFTESGSTPLALAKSAFALNRMHLCFFIMPVLGVSRLVLLLSIEEFTLSLAKVWQVTVVIARHIAGPSREERSGVSLLLCRLIRFIFRFRLCCRGRSSRQIKWWVEHLRQSWFSFVLLNLLDALVSRCKVASIKQLLHLHVGSELPLLKYFWSELFFCLLDSLLNHQEHTSCFLLLLIEQMANFEYLLSQSLLNFLSIWVTHYLLD